MTATAVQKRKTLRVRKSMLDQRDSSQATEDGHQRVDHQPLMPANGLDGHGAGPRRGEFLRRIEMRIKHGRARIVVHVAIVSLLESLPMTQLPLRAGGLPLHSRITLTQAAGNSPRKPAQARLTGASKCYDNQTPLDFTT